MEIAPTTQADIPALQSLLERVALFPADMLPDLLAQQDGAVWLTCHDDRGAIGFCYAVAEELTEGTWNMRALGVDPDARRSGAGARLCTGLENRLRTDGQRLVIVDTSGTDDFAAARAFYASCGYQQEAVIRDFWAAGDDKVTFRKQL